MPSRIAVRMKLVQEFVLDRIFDAVEDRDPGTVPEAIAPALAAPLDAVLGGEGPAAGADPGATEVAATLARKGYLTRVVETELFERARGVTPGLADAVRERWLAPRESWPETVVAVAGDLARREPADRPDPGDERACTWDVPAPGGHVRHYLAIRAARIAPDAPALEEADRKRCWIYGFYVRCCEESLPADAPLAAERPAGS